MHAWNSLALVPLASLVLRVLVNALVLRKNPRWIVSRIFVVLSIAVIFWDVGETMMTLTAPAYVGTMGVFWARIEWLGVPLTAALTFQFALACARFYGKRPGVALADVLLYVPVIPFMYLIAATDQIVLGTVSGMGRVVATRNDTVANSAFTLYYTILVFGTLYVLFRARTKATETRARKELTWFFVAFTIPSLYATTLGLWLAGQPGLLVASFAIYDATLGVSAACLAYAIVRYQLFNLSVPIFVRKAFIAFVSLLLALGFFGALVVASYAREGDISLSNPILLLVFLLLAVLLSRRWERWATRIVETILPALKWKETRIGDVFLVDGSGLLITRVSGQSDDQIDRDILVGMLSVVQEFIRTSFAGPSREKREGLNVLSYGNTRILIEHGELCYLVVVFDGFEIEEMRPDIRRTLAEIHDRYASRLMTWDGTPELGEAIHPLLATMLGRSTAA